MRHYYTLPLNTFQLQKKQRHSLSVKDALSEHKSSGMGVRRRELYLFYCSVGSTYNSSMSNYVGTKTNLLSL